MTERRVESESAAVKVYTRERTIGDGVIGIHTASGERECKPHTHEFIEIVYITDGEGIQTVDGVSYCVGRGDTLFLNYGAMHAFSSAGGLDFIEIYFSPRLVEEGVVTPADALTLLALSSFDDMRREQNGGKMTFVGRAREEVEQLLSAMVREFRDRAPSYAMVIENLLNVLLIQMLRCTDQAETLTDDIWQSLRAYIDSHPQEQMSLTALASRCFYNPSYFSRVFKQKFGVSPTEYIRTRRIEHAKELLACERMTVEAVMEQCGYLDRSTFYHAFSKRVGVTPAEYRESCRKSKETLHQK